MQEFLPIHTAAHAGNAPCIKILLEHGAKADALDGSAKLTPLFECGT